MADRRYEFPELAFPPGHWANEVGREYRMAGVAFQSSDDIVVLALPDANLHRNHLEDRVYDLSPEEWSEVLRRSDDPLVFQRDETGTVKAWVRKAQYIISGEVQQRVWVRDGLKCMFCGKKIGEVLLTVDHFMPLELGGANDPSNLIALCRPCNKRKGSQHPAYFCRAMGLDYQYFVEYLKNAD